MSLFCTRSPSRIPHVIVTSPEAPLDLTAFLTFFVLGDLGSFEDSGGILATISIGIYFWHFSHYRLELRVWGNEQSEVSSSHLITGMSSQQDSTAEMEFPLLAEVTCVRFLPCKVSPSSPVPHCTLWNDVNTNSPHSGGGAST